MDEVQFKEALNEKSTQVESLLKEYLPKEEGYQKKVIQAMNYSLMAGGKRLRPILMYETYRMLGGKGKGNLSLYGGNGDDSYLFPGA